MSIYHRFASLEHDEAFFRAAKRPAPSAPPPRTLSAGSNTSLYGREALNLPPLGAQFMGDSWRSTDGVRLNDTGELANTTVDNSTTANTIANTSRRAPRVTRTHTLQEWQDIFAKAAYFTGYDPLYFQHMLIVIYQNSSGRISTKSITRFGVTTYDNLILDSRSRFWPSCENLLPEHRRSNVRKSIAISTLKNYTKLSNEIKLSVPWDETNAGNLANEMNLLSEKPPLDLGNKLLHLGLIQPHTLSTVLLDTVYDNFSDQATSKIVEDNNKMVFLLGEQLDQLFDPLLEYSPEAMEINYNVSAASSSPPLLDGNEKIESIIEELISTQTNYTMGLVNLLQNFIIPLRIHVLSNSKNASNPSTSKAGITKINQVFPPTIDEITRINCILHDSLNKAKYYGYVEVFKVLGMILPYFYKAFIRHEANLKSFSAKINKFSQRNHARIFENRNLNKGAYTVREIDSIVSGSLFELPKLKLILKRLYDTVFIQMGSKNTSDEMTYITQCYTVAIEVIDAFGGRLPEDGLEFSNPKHRFFTPSGKLLTELASKWPEELQYDWLSRKVVGIFELKSVKPAKDSLCDMDVLIIFSDYLLILTVNDSKYYLKRHEDSSRTVSVSDILMHSLINEKPLPNLNIFPSMEVSGWVEIGHVIASTYKAMSSIDKDTEGSFLRFLSTKEYGFNSSSKYTNVTRNYEIVNNQDDGSKIIELITKAKVLHKSQSFHLFKSAPTSLLPSPASAGTSVTSLHCQPQEPELTIYSTAHNIDAYEIETCKSPFALFLNITFDEPQRYFETHPGLYLIVSASFVNDHTIQLIGFSKDGSFELNEIIQAPDLQVTLKKILSTNYELIFRTHNLITNSLAEGYKNDLEYYLDVFTSYSTERLRANIKQKEFELQEQKRKQELEEKKKSAPQIKTPQPVKRSSEVPVQTLNKKKSIIHKLFHTFKKSNEATKVTNTSAPKDYEAPASRKIEARAPMKIEAQAPKKIEAQAPKKIESKNKMSDSYIPRGDKAEYTHLYKPIPELKRSDESTIGEESLQRVQSRAVSIPKYSIDTQYVAPRTSQELTRSSQELRRASQELRRASEDIRRVSKEMVAMPQETSTNSNLIANNASFSEPRAQRNSEEIVKTSQGVMRSPQPVVSRQRALQSAHDAAQRTRAQELRIPEAPKVQEERTRKISFTPEVSRVFPSRTSSNYNNSLGTVVQNRIVSVPRSTTEENVMALDMLHKQRRKSQSSRLSISYLDFGNVPAEEYYNDGETNWVTISRDNSSLYGEVQKLKAQKEPILDQSYLSAMDYSKNTDSPNSTLEIQSILDVGRSTTSLGRDPNASMDQVLDGSDGSETKEAKELLKARHGSSSTFEIPDNYFRKDNKEESMQSLSSAQVIEEFKKTIDFDSELDILNVSEPEIVPRETSVIHSPRANSSNITLTSSEDEYYSPNEFDFSTSLYQLIDDAKAAGSRSQTRNPVQPPKNHSDTYLIQSTKLDSPTFTSSSSDATIINERNQSQLQEQPERYFNSFTSKDNSIAYLSDLLNGSINF